MAKGIIDEIENRIEMSRPGTVFLTKDFTDIATNTTIRKCLGRQVDAGNLRRIMQGVYEKPAYSKLLKQYLPTDPDAVANAIATTYRWTIAPCGDLALNKLGLSTQVPAKWSYISDGPYRDFSWDNITIEFKHRTNRDISGISTFTTMLIEAIRALGKDRINENTIQQIHNLIPENQRLSILEEAKSSTDWIYNIIRKACA